MRWWWRIVVTLVLAPIVWLLAAIYLGTTTGGTADALAKASLASLPKLYLIYNLPALAVIALVLLPVDRLLTSIGADLLIVAVAPILAYLVPVVLSLVIHDPRLDATAIHGLAFTYGLVFGLTIREPRWTTGAAANNERNA